MLKTKAVTLLGLITSSFAFAGTMGPVCTPGNVTVPCEAKRWDLGIQALYLRSLYNGNKGYLQASAPVTQSVLNQVRDGWDWGYRLEGSYHFNTGNDATVTWMHYRGTVNQTGLQGFVLITDRPDQPLTFIGKNRMDQVNLVLGQHVDFSAVKTMRFYGGLQIAHIQDNNTKYFSVLTPAQVIPGLPLILEQNDNNDYRGIGPVAGIDYAYAITDAFSVTANGAASILVGRSRYTNRFLASGLGLVLAGAYGNKSAMVPSLEAKLGVNYAFALGDGVLHLQGGYQALNYFNAMQTLGFRQLAFSPSTDIASSNYGLFGPYFGLKYVGNA